MRISLPGMVLVSCLLMPRLAVAQRASLATVDSLLKAGQSEAARTALAKWRKENGADASAVHEARATYLAGRLALRADSAEDYYLAVALSHGTSPYAAESLLRLGQARLTSGDARQAEVYLQRLLTDYPTSNYRALGSLWLARSQMANTRVRSACATVRSALQRQPTDAETTSLLRNEERVACGSAAPAARAATPSAARYAIQLGAFRERAGALAYKREIEKAGFQDVRVTVMPENALFRVRVGAYESVAGAQPTVARLKVAGFVGVVLEDRQRERIVQN